MEGQQRGRSPSAGHANHSLGHSRSPSAQTSFNNQATAHGTNTALFQSGALAPDQSTQSSSFANLNYLTPNYSPSFPHQPDFSQHPLEQQTQISTSYADSSSLSPPDTNLSAGVNPQFLVASNVNSNQGLQDFYAQNGNLNAQQPDEFGIFRDMPAGFNPMQSSHNHSYNGGLSQSFDQSQSYHQGTRSRGQSLSPSSAAATPGQAAHEWAGMAFQGHRRNPSADAYSDMSSHHSPFVDAVESFDPISGVSPNLNGQGDPSLVSDPIGGLNQFSISDANVIHSQHTSPGQSNHASPHFLPQQGVPFNDNEDFGLLATDPGPQMFPNSGPGTEEFPKDTQYSANNLEGGTNTEMETPQINIQFAPERQPTLNDSSFKGELGMDALSPPTRSTLSSCIVLWLMLILLRPESPAWSSYLGPVCDCSNFMQLYPWAAASSIAGLAPRYNELSVVSLTLTIRST